MAKLNITEQESPIENITSTQSMAQPIKRKGKKKFTNFVIFILFVAVLVLGYGYYQKKTELKLIKDPKAQSELAKKEALEITQKLKEFVILPSTDEIPEILTINDAALAVKEQSNLEGVVDGDKILLYSKAGKAYIYSPSRNILVNILPVSMQRQQPSTESQPQTTAQPKTTSTTTPKAPAETKQDNS